VLEVQRFVEEKIDPDWIDRHAEIPLFVIEGLGKLGVLGMTVPKEFGGLGMSQHAYCKVAEVIARRCGSTALFLNAHQSIGLKALQLFGSDAQRKQWLAPLAKGEQLAAFSLTEPNAGSDAAGIETRAVFDPVKNVYIINGKKQWTTNGSIAHMLTLMAKTSVETPGGKQDKITAFLVTPDMPGFKVVAAALEKVGMRGSKTANLHFHDLEVPAANVLGKVGGGLKMCLTVLDYGRTTFGATCTGAAKTAYELAVQHAKTRLQFNRPLAAFGLVKKKIARMAALVYAMDATTYLTAGLVDTGHEDIMLESAMLKVFSSEALWSILYDSMQIFGGRSFFTDLPLERMMRDARLNMIGEGSNEVMRAFIGAVGMRDVGLQLQGIGEAIKRPWAGLAAYKQIFKEVFRRMRAAHVPIRTATLQQEAKRLAKLVQRFGNAVFKLLVHYREGIVEQQLELERIADSAIAIYTSAAVLSKLDNALQQKKKNDHLDHDLAAGKLYCQMAAETVECNLNFLFSKNDKAIEALADSITAGPAK
jgi:alkylation response protein AidB-like acyl-CoA dehydrogenase